MLLLDREEVFVRLATAEYDGLATQGPDLSASNVEYVAMASQPG